MAVSPIPATAVPEELLCGYYLKAAEAPEIIVDLSTGLGRLKAGFSLVLALGYLGPSLL
jgi:hypothetical protein